MTDDAAFAAYTAEVKRLVQNEHDRLFAEDAALVREEPVLHHVHAAIGEYVGRGGKRVRAVLCATAYEGLGGARADIAGALLAVELLHAYLLVHDDWMDRDALRRGGPTLHTSFGARFGDAHRGASAAILAGDYLSATAQRALLTARVDAANVRDACRVFSIMQRDVVWGQVLDTVGSGDTPAAVEAMHALKTASYTATGPVALGAALIGASESVRAALDEITRPLGLAFQLADDLASAYAEGAASGKARFGDLREGKCSALVAEGLRDDAFRAAWQAFIAERVSLQGPALDARVESLAADLERLGARTRVSDARARHVQRAVELVDASPLAPPSRAVMRGFASSLLQGAA